MARALDRLDRLNVPRAGQALYWQECHGCASSLAIARLCRTRTAPGIVVTESQEQAFQVANELEFFDPEHPVDVFPDLETLPYDTFSPQSDVVSERLTFLTKLQTGAARLMVVPMRALQSRLPPAEFVRSQTMVFETGDDFDCRTQSHALAEVGYRVVDQVLEPGDMAIRGSIFDIYPVGSAVPIRLDLFDERIDSIREFDPESQRTTGHTDATRLMPAKEYPLDNDAIELFRTAWHVAFDGDARNSPTYQQVSEGIAAEGVECYLPLFFEETQSLFDYMPAEALFILASGAHQAALDFWSEVNDRYAKLGDDPARPLLPPRRLYLHPEEIQQRLRPYSRIGLDHDKTRKRHVVSLGAGELPSVDARPRTQDPIQRLRKFLGNVERRVLVTAETRGRLDHLDDFLKRGSVVATQVGGFAEYLAGTSEVAIAVAPLDRPLWLDDVVVLSESQIFGPVGRSGRRRLDTKTTDPELAIRNLTELRIGAPVVHLDHGVGRYRGLETLVVDDCEGEFLLLEYAGGDKLYVPVSSLHLVSRFTGASEDAAPLDKLGSDRWEKAKKRAEAKVRDVAAELLDIYARREASSAFAYPQADADFRQFCDECEFDLTPDQGRAVDEALQDMSSSKATDRLVCGDVGFGKTEVAMRAAFHAVLAGKQVAVLVPTTLLAQQHLESFQNRFSGWPHCIEVVSRFRSKMEIERLRDKLKGGHVDILIGTHRLLHADLTFKDLGLLVVDEEHRFGVAAKERLKVLRASVDVLTLTATPIPRTLNMAVGGIRDLSIIATPPAKRLSVRTFIARSSRQLISDALHRELARGGQAFFVHNEVQSIERKAQEIAEIMPNARIGIGHGQMPKRSLEGVMADFYHRRCNVLVCSTIIESGIDVPNANTIVVERADRFGLAQLHQLRGRVGRSHRQAYAYLLVPEEPAMTPDAVKRLEAIQRSGDLGIGFNLALHDLEIRGAGELLGKDQSGQIEAIGFTLYMEMLERTVNAMKLGSRIDLDVPLHAPGELEMELHVPALIPDDYLPDIHLRLVMYKRMAMAENEDQLRELRIEMIDRFGLLPDPARNLFRIAKLRLSARQLCVAKINFGSSGGFVDFLDDTPLDPAVFLRFVSSQPARLRMTGPSRLRVSGSFTSGDSRFVALEELVGELHELASVEKQVA